MRVYKLTNYAQSKTTNQNGMRKTHEYFLLLIKLNS